jgi:protein involved in temperature-dependent protein secretion
MMSAPVYVKVDEYKDISDIMSLMREKVSQARDLLDRIAELKKKEDAEISAWMHELDEVQRRIQFIDKTLVEPDL